MLDKNCVRDLAMFRGLPPYDTPSNYTRGDGYFIMSINNKYGRDMVDKVNAELDKLELKYRRYADEIAHMIERL